MDRSTVESLHRLYGRRENLQKAREYAWDQNMWLGVIGQSFQGTGTRNAVLAAIGGEKAMAQILSITIAERIEVIMQGIDAEITDLGGAA